MTKKLHSGRKTSAWPTGIGGAGKMTSISVPYAVKEPVHKLAKIYAQFVAGQITQNEFFERIRDIIFDNSSETIKKIYGQVQVGEIALEDALQRIEKLMSKDLLQD